MKSKQIRQQLQRLIEARNELAFANETLKFVSKQVFENLDLAIDELEDAYIAQANAENTK
jgi:hypothetical protein